RSRRSPRGGPQRGGLRRRIQVVRGPDRRSGGGGRRHAGVALGLPARGTERAGGWSRTGPRTRPRRGGSEWVRRRRLGLGSAPRRNDDAGEGRPGSAVVADV